MKKLEKLRKFGKNKLSMKEAIEIIENEKYEYIVPGSRLDLALERITEKILKEEN